MPRHVNTARDALLAEARARGCTVTENKLWWRVDGRHPTQWFNIARNGTKVTLTGFTIARPGVMSFSPEDSHDLKIGRVGGIFDFMDPGAGGIIAELWKAIRSDVRG